MTCRQLIDFLGDYVEGSLPVETRKLFEAHLHDCSDCRRYLAQYKSTIDFTRALGEEKDLPGKLPAGLLKAIAKSCEQAK